MDKCFIVDKMAGSSVSFEFSLSLSEVVRLQIYSRCLLCAPVLLCVCVYVAAPALTNAV